jgi:hypothetical protein
MGAVGTTPSGSQKPLGVRQKTPNVGNQRLATLREPHRPILSRVRCIAWFAVASGRLWEAPTSHHR